MIKFKDLKVGEALSETQYYTVEKIVGDKVQIKNDNQESIVVNKDYLESCLVSATQVSSTKTINKTEAANLFISNPGVAICVNFNKQVKEADVLKEVMEKVSGASIKDIEKEVKKGIKKALEGEERTMIGRHNGDVDDFGRVKFIDMEIAKGSGGYDARIRQVDPRQINSLTIKGVKYTVK